MEDGIQYRSEQSFKAARMETEIISIAEYCIIFNSKGKLKR